MSANPKSRPHRRGDGIPTRCDLSLMTPAELAIVAAMRAVEEAGASIALTDALNMLSAARDRVADHVEGATDAKGNHVVLPGARVTSFYFPRSFCSISSEAARLSNECGHSLGC